MGVARELSLCLGCLLSLIALGAMVPLLGSPLGLCNLWGAVCSAHPPASACALRAVPAS